MNMREKFKLKVASLLHSMFPGKYCWADCVVFAFSNTRWNPFKIDSAKGCEIESKEHSTKMCYCGGWNNGQCWDKLPKKEQERIRAEIKKEMANEPEDLPF